MARSPERGGRYTFESDWVVKENEWARDKGIPIIALYDGDRSRERMEAPPLGVFSGVLRHLERLRSF